MIETSNPILTELKFCRVFDDWLGRFSLRLQTSRACVVCVPTFRCCVCDIMRSSHYVVRSFGLWKSLLRCQPISSSQQRLANATEFVHSTSECARVRACSSGFGGRVAVKLAVDFERNPGALLRTMLCWAELIMGRACLGYRRRIRVNARFIINRASPANSMPQTHSHPPHPDCCRSIFRAF